MIFMNREIEKLGGKQFQFFPLKKSIIPRYIVLDTKALIELFPCVYPKNKCLSNIEIIKDFIWESHFDIENKLFKEQKFNLGYEFDYLIRTNGYSHVQYNLFTLL